MTLLADIRNFFAREKGCALLFLFLLGIYLGNLFWPGKPVERPPSESEAIQELRLAEMKLKEEIRQAGSVQEFLTHHPQLLLAFNLFTLLLLATIGVGLFLELAWITHPVWRQRLLVTETPPEARHWGIGTIFKVILLFVTLSLGLGLFLSLLKSLLFPEVSGNFLSLIHTTLSDLTVIGLVIYFLQRRGGDWRELGFRGIHFWNDLLVGLAGYVAILPLFFIVLFAVVLMAYLFTYEPPPHPLVEILLEEEKRSPATVAYSIFLACGAGPIFEEIFFRGFCYPAFKKRWGIFWALVLSSSLFALIHQNLFAFLPIFVLGLGLGYLYEKRGTLTAPIVLHVVHNSIFVAYFFLAKEVLAGL